MALSANGWIRLIIFIILTPISIYFAHQTYLSYLEVQRLEAVVEQSNNELTQAVAEYKQEDQQFRNQGCTPVGSGQEYTHEGNTFIAYREWSCPN